MPWTLRKFLYNEDWDALPKSTKRQVLSDINKLKINPYIGKKLEYKPLMGGDLSDCYRIHVSETLPDWEQHPVVVYQIHKEANEIEIISIGKRLGSEAYHKALKRLGRGHRHLSGITEPKYKPPKRYRRTR